MPHSCVKIGVGGPVGSGKTALLDTLCKRLRQRYAMAVITNDIYTREDAEFLIRSAALPSERIMGVETGGCPHTAIREDASMNIDAVERMIERFPDLDLVFVESGGDNLAASFSPELVDAVIPKNSRSSEQAPVEEIQQRVSKAFGISRAELVGSTRAATPLNARQVAIYLTRELIAILLEHQIDALADVLGDGDFRPVVQRLEPRVLLGRDVDGRRDLLARQDG